MVFTTGYPMRQVHSQTARAQGQFRNASQVRRSELVDQGLQNIRTGTYAGKITGISSSYVHLDSGINFSTGELANYQVVPAKEGSRGER